MNLNNRAPGHGADNLNELWNNTEAVEYQPLPAGIYEAHVSGELHKSKSGTPGYQLTFVVVDPENHAGRRVWHDCWLTTKAMPRSKAELAKIGITKREQLDRPITPGTRCKIQVAIRMDDSGVSRNRISKIELMRVDQPTVDAFAPTKTSPEMF